MIQIECLESVELTPQDLDDITVARKRLLEIIKTRLKTYKEKDPVIYRELIKMHYIGESWDLL